jgi:preprotein translocase subunit SecA
VDLPHDQWDIDGLKAAMLDAIPQLETFDFDALRGMTPAEAQDALLGATADAFDARKEELSPTMMNSLSRYVLLQVVDQHWKEHLHGMDVLRQGIGLRGYGQRDPFTEYKFEATNMFNDMIDTLKAEVTKFLFRMQFGQTV